MEKFFYSLLICVFVYSCSVQKEKYDQNSLNSEVSTEKIFLNDIKEGLENTEGVSIKLFSYSKKGEIANDEQKKSLISDIVNEKNYNFFIYDNTDKTYSDLEIKKMADYKNSSKHNKQKIISSLEEALNHTSSILDQRIEVGYEVYEISWKLDDNIYNSLAVFNDQEFIYDNFISNLTTSEFKKITPEYYNRD